MIRIRAGLDHGFAQNFKIISHLVHWGQDVKIFENISIRVFYVPFETFIFRGPKIWRVLWEGHDRFCATVAQRVFIHGIIGRQIHAELVLLRRIRRAVFAVEYAVGEVALQCDMNMLRAALQNLPVRTGSAGFGEPALLRLVWGGRLEFLRHRAAFLMDLCHTGCIQCADFRNILICVLCRKCRGGQHGCQHTHQEQNRQNTLFHGSCSSFLSIFRERSLLPHGIQYTWRMDHSDFGGESRVRCVTASDRFFWKHISRHLLSASQPACASSFSSSLA